MTVLEFHVIVLKRYDHSLPITEPVVLEARM